MQKRKQTIARVDKAQCLSYTITWLEKNVATLVVLLRAGRVYGMDFVRVGTIMQSWCLQKYQTVGDA